MKSNPQCVKIESLNWRIDVSLSSSSLKRELVPTIVIQMQLTNGMTIYFETNLQLFHQLRFNVALVLKEMDDLLNRQIFKLTD